MASSPRPAEPQLRRKPKMADTPASTSSTPAPAARRGSPYLPTSRESLLLAVFPVLLLFGTLFSLLSPQTRAAAAAGAASTGSGPGSGTAHYPQAPSLAPSYFARKDNLLNVFFVKRGWFWITITFAFFVGTHPYYAEPSAPRKHVLGRRSAAVLRWGLVTGWWFLVTQWFFGPALIDRNYRLTGGGCQALQALTDEAGAAASSGEGGKHAEATYQFLEAATASACKHAGGQWRGGHDISGHVFLLVLGTTFLAQEVGWVLWRQAQRRAAISGGVPGSTSHSSSTARVVDTRLLVMDDGAVKSAEVEAGLATGSTGEQNSSAARAGLMQPDTRSANAALLSRVALRVTAAAIGLSLWMLLMTAIYFHTWFEKLTGLLVALVAFYSVYVLPRWVPALRRVVGLPGL
ncbi:hypothetical protein SPBR_07396 [Sporothrix brasiliensis 5110]|uniref:Acyl-coenzyme A diphosphatase SCS3 n=1 Tax=Sporothrix brasiliensis 5110 TaxID=1398154 RepID=A0A0C2FEB5_9PEZI|nr:uncharacterized protein SPBR_07396 [Sporothrix brasiliensis 5110]KIH89493.1 hypothetical protein SPBR_07396 [Sporothrix brasiliensis 5110]